MTQPNDLRTNKSILRDLTGLNSLSKQIKVHRQEIIVRRRELERAEQDLNQKEMNLQANLMELSVRLEQLQRRDENRQNLLDRVYMADEEIRDGLLINTVGIRDKLLFLYVYEPFDRFDDTYRDLVERYTGHRE